jgi:hypothetical protein
MYKKRRITPQTGNDTPVDKQRGIFDASVDKQRDAER